MAEHWFILKIEAEKTVFALLLFKTLLRAYFYGLTHVQPHFWESSREAPPVDMAIHRFILGICKTYSSFIPFWGSVSSNVYSFHEQTMPRYKKLSQNPHFRE